MSPDERADLLETLLLARLYYLDAFDRSRHPLELAALLDAARYVDEAIDLLADSAPDLADEVESRRPLVHVPDRLPEGMH